ncbi:MAG: hypothetical protein HZA67_02715 [Rhodospirillales bacterium]|nr:hypothetical protein [Rhodospirillales bacterium]
MEGNTENFFRRKTCSCLLLLALASAFSLPLTCYAQDINRLEKRYEVPRETKSVHEPIIPENWENFSEDDAAEIKIEIVGVEITGSTEGILRWSQDFVPPQPKEPNQRLAYIKEVRNAIITALSAPSSVATVGYGPFTVNVPPQTVRNGILWVRIIDQSASGITIREVRP